MENITILLGFTHNVFIRVVLLILWLLLLLTALHNGKHHSSVWLHAQCIHPYCFTDIVTAVITDRFHTVIFSALEQTRCAHVARDSDWMTVFFYRPFLLLFLKKIKERNSRNWCTDSSIWLLNGWCHVKLPLSRRTFCLHHTTMHQFTESFHSKPHT